MPNSHHLHDFVFHYNHLNNKWSAVKRDHYAELFSGNKGNVISSSQISTLIALINKYRGSIDKINESIK